MQSLTTLTVESRSFGGGDASVGLPDVAVEFSDQEITVRDLIAVVVREQIQQLRQRRAEQAVHISLLLARQYLLPADIAEQAMQGQIAMPSQEAKALPQIDVTKEVAKALDGFERRAYRVIVDGGMRDNLADIVTLKSDTRITFLRLMPLVGG